MYASVFSKSTCFKDRLTAIVVNLISSSTFAISPPAYTPPGHALILSGRCEDFSKIAVQTDDSKEGRNLGYPWAASLSNLPIPKQVECLGLLPLAIQHEILIGSISLAFQKEPDLRLIDAWRISGGDLNSVKTETENLTTVVASMGYTAPLIWLKNFGVKPLRETDKANELTAASRRMNGPWRSDWNKTPWTDTLVFDWLLANGYAWPLELTAAHELLSNLALLRNENKFQSAVDFYEKKGLFGKLVEFDKTQALRPIIYSARSAKAVDLVYKIGFDIHAPIVDKKTGKIILNSALDVSGLPGEIQTALLNLKVSVKGGKDANLGSLYAVLSGSTVDLSIVERYLQAGAPLHVDTVSTQAGSGIRLQAMHFVAQLSPTVFKDGELEKLIQLLGKYGADPNSIQDGITTDYRFGNLPIHTAIYQRLWGPFKGTQWKAGLPTFAVWIKESKIRPDIKHPQHKVSLLGYALKHSHFLPTSQAISVVNDLVAIGAPINPEGESLILEPLKANKKANLELISKLIELGANPNRVDSQTGLTALTYLLTAQPYRTTDCLLWRPQYGGSRPDCVNETREERLQLIKWFISRGANAGIKDGNGVSALDLADAFTEPEKRLAYRNALSGRGL
jgi:hypothetical protein